MKALTAYLQLSTNLHGRSRERCPHVIWQVDDEPVAEIRTDVEQPALPLADGSIDLLEIRDDAISRVMDEAAWLAECQRVLAVDGEIRLTLPSSGPLSWLDAMNMHRYAVDIGKRGDPPDSTLPTGWNRHYSPEDIALLMQDAGFVEMMLRSATYAGNEVRLFARLFWHNWIRGNRRAELEYFPRLGQRRYEGKRFPVGTTLSITARKRA